MLAGKVIQEFCTNLSQTSLSLEVLKVLQVLCSRAFSFELLALGKAMSVPAIRQQLQDSLGGINACGFCWTDW